MLIELEQDILKDFDIGLLDAIGHGCNTQGKFAAGIAGQIAKQFPETKEDYLHSVHKQYAKLGDVYHSVVARYCHFSGTIFNCFTQEKYGNDGKIYADLEAIKSVAKYLQKHVEEQSFNGLYRLGIPRIGCGLGGLKWKEEVKPILAETFKFDVLYIYNLGAK